MLKRLSTKIGKLIPKDVQHTSGIIKDAIKTGWQNGKAQALVDNKNLMQDMYMRTRGVTTEVKKLKFTKDDIPAVAAVIGNFIPVPIPGLTIWSYFAGKGIKKAIEIYSKINK